MELKAIGIGQKTDIARSVRDPDDSELERLIALNKSDIQSRSEAQFSKNAQTNAIRLLDAELRNNFDAHRHTSDVDMPRSYYGRIEMICSSLNLLFRIWVSVVRESQFKGGTKRVSGHSIFFYFQYRFTNKLLLERMFMMNRYYDYKYIMLIE